VAAMTSHTQDQQKVKNQEAMFEFRENSHPVDAGDEDSQDDEEDEEEEEEEEEAAEDEEENDPDKDNQEQQQEEQRRSAEIEVQQLSRYQFQQLHHEPDEDFDDDDSEGLGKSLLNEIPRNNSNINTNYDKLDGSGGYHDDDDDDDELKNDSARRTNGDLSFRKQYQEKRQQRRRLVAGIASGAAGLVMVGPCTAVAAGIGGVMLLKRLDKKRKENVKNSLRENETETASLLSPKTAQV